MNLKRIVAVILCVLTLTASVGAYSLSDDPMESVVRLGKYSSKIDPTVGFAEDQIILFVNKPYKKKSPYHDYKPSDFPSLELRGVELIESSVDYYREAYALYLKTPGRREVAAAIVALESSLGAVSEHIDAERVFPCPAISPLYDYLDLEGAFTGTVRTSLDDLGAYWMNEAAVVVQFKEAPTVDPITSHETVFPELDVESVERLGYRKNSYIVKLKHTGKRKLDYWFPVYEALKSLNGREDIENAHPETYVIDSPCVYIPSSSDWKKDAWYAPHISYVLRRKWMKTESFPKTFYEEQYRSNGEKYTIEQSGTHICFYPEMPLTRAMLITTLYRIATEDSGKDSTAVCSAFSDVKDGAWYTKAVSWGVENGIVDGVGGGLFAPNREITREELVTVLYRFHSKWNLSPVRYSRDYNEFSDHKSVSAWADTAMRWAVGNLIIKGRDGGVLAPTSPVTRAECAKILARYDDYVPKK